MRFAVPFELPDYAAPLGPNWRRHCHEHQLRVSHAHAVSSFMKFGVLRPSRCGMFAHRASHIRAKAIPRESGWSALSDIPAP